MTIQIKYIELLLTNGDYVTKIRNNLRIRFFYNPVEKREAISILIALNTNSIKLDQWIAPQQIALLEVLEAYGRCAVFIKSAGLKLEN